MITESLIGVAKNVTPDLAAGIVVGQSAEPVLIEAFAHMNLAHRNVDVNPSLAAAARYALIVCGLSPNRFASKHRIHHLVDTAAPRGPLDTIRHVMQAGRGINDIGEVDPSKLLFPGYSFDDDPLVRETSIGLEYRHDPWMERVVGKGGMLRFGPFVAAIMVNGAANKVARRDMPFSRAFAFMSGVQFGLTNGALMTAYAEGRAGIAGGTLGIDRVSPPLRNKLSRHQEHHSSPDKPTAGLSTRTKIAFAALTKLGLIKSSKD